MSADLPAASRGPQVAGESMADRLMKSIDYRLQPDMPHLTRDQVAVVVRALADHTAIQEALRYDVDKDGPWPFATSIGRWFHAVGDQLEEMGTASMRCSTCGEPFDAQRHQLGGACQR